MEKVKETPAWVVYDVNREPITIPKPTVDILLRQKYPDTLLLWVLLRTLTKWEGMKHEVIEDDYLAKKLNWSIANVRIRKQILFDLALIEKFYVKVKDRKIGPCIHVNYLWD